MWKIQEYNKAVVSTEIIQKKNRRAEHEHVSEQEE